MNLGLTTGIKETKALTPGIHKAKFVGISLDKLTAKDGTTYNVMKLTLNIENYGEWSHNFFEPDNSLRTSGMFGENPSREEHFLVSIRQIFDALDPTIGERIDTDTVTVPDKDGKEVKVNVGKLSFEKLVKLAEILTANSVGKELNIKIIPNRGYCDFPGFPARITRSGALAISTRFISSADKELSISDKEMKAIDAYMNATPTNMKTVDVPQETNNDTITELMDTVDEVADDLPF